MSKIGMLHHNTIIRDLTFRSVLLRKSFLYHRNILQVLCLVPGGLMLRLKIFFVSLVINIQTKALILQTKVQYIEYATCHRDLFEAADA